MSHLPLVDAHDKEHTYCTFCPKLCRHACPVATVEARETTTPWGKMAALHHVAEGNAVHDAEVAATWYACTGCMRCKSFCDHDNEVADALSAGRAEALAAGTAPRPARELREDHKDREARAAASAEALFGEAGARRSRTAYAPGCTACVAVPGEAKAGLAAVEALVGTEARVVAGRCCGLPLLDAGDQGGFIRAATAYLEALRGVDRVVFLDPGCLHALRKTLPALARGETPSSHAGPELLHLSELAAQNLDAVSPLELEGSVRYHDPCRLGRGLGIYEPPRAVLTRILGQRPGEMHHHRSHAECSGAGGQVPRTAPETSKAIAQERRADHELVGGGTLVSPCPASQRALEKSGTPVRGFAGLLAESLSGSSVESSAEAGAEAERAGKLPT